MPGDDLATGAGSEPVNPGGVPAVDVAPRRSVLGRTDSLRAAAVAALLARGVTVVGSLVVTPLAASELSLSGFQQSLVLLTLTVFAGLGDWGVGLSLLTLLPATQNEYERSRLVKVAYRLSTLSSAGAAVVGIAVVMTGWGPELLLGTSSTSARVSSLGLVIGISLAILANVRLRMLGATSRQVEQNLHYGTAFFVSYVVSVVLLLTTHSAALYVTSSAALPQLLIVSSTSVRLRRVLPVAKVALDMSSVRKVSSHAASLSLQVLAILIAVQSDVAITSRMLGSGAAAELALVNKVVSPYVLVIAIASNPLWPVFARKIGQGEWGFVQRQLRRVTAMGVAMAVVYAAALVLLGPFAVHALSAGRLHVSAQYWWAGALWCVVLGFHSPLSIFVNAVGARRTQTWTALSMLVLNLGGTIALLPVLGGPAAIWSTAVSYVVTMCIPNFLLYRRRLVNAQRVAEPDGA